MLFNNRSLRYKRIVGYKALHVVKSVKHIGQVKAALKYVDLARVIINDDLWCDDLQQHLKSKYDIERVNHDQ